MACSSSMGDTELRSSAGEVGLHILKKYIIFATGSSCDNVTP